MQAITTCIAEITEDLLEQAIIQLCEMLKLKMGNQDLERLTVNLMIQLLPVSLKRKIKIIKICRQF